MSADAAEEAIFAAIERLSVSADADELFTLAQVYDKVVGEPEAEKPEAPEKAIHAVGETAFHDISNFWDEGDRVGFTPVNMPKAEYPPGWGEWLAG